MGSEYKFAELGHSQNLPSFEKLGFALMRTQQKSKLNKVQILRASIPLGGWEVLTKKCGSK